MEAITELQALATERDLDVDIQRSKLDPERGWSVVLEGGPVYGEGDSIEAACRAVLAKVERRHDP